MRVHRGTGLGMTVSLTGLKQHIQGDRLDRGPEYVGGVCPYVPRVTDCVSRQGTSELWSRVWTNGRDSLWKVSGTDGECRNSKVFLYGSRGSTL